MIPDLSQKRMVSLDEVAALFRRAPKTIKRAVNEGRFPVMPRERGRGNAMQWSSVDLARYFDDPKWAAKCGTRGGTK